MKLTINEILDEEENTTGEYLLCIDDDEEEEYNDVSELIDRIYNLLTDEN